jgi:DNA-directed RNA polymerase subunit alpha
MESLILPSSITWNAGTRPHEATVTIEPCYFGYGTTLGNALRRVLVSSLTGAAVIGIKIEGVSHEFSAVQHVQEDVMELLLNFGQIRCKVFSDEPVRLSLDVAGKQEVTAADITKQSDVEIVNPDLHLATLTDDNAEFHAQIFVERGRGYVPTDARKNEKSEIGMMAIDAIYTPVRNVGFRVENTRVGEITNYDRLLLTIETDGSLTPQEALHQASDVIMSHFSLFLTGGSPAGAMEEISSGQDLASNGAESETDESSAAVSDEEK